jgi:hypothetical protein
MKAFMEQLGYLLLGEEQQLKLELRELQVQFIRNENAILKQFQLCKKSRGLVGVYSPVFGKGMFLTTVDEIIDNEETIIFKPYDISGNFLEKTAVSLKDISCICPFNQIYTEPAYNIAHENVPEVVHLDILAC